MLSFYEFDLLLRKKNAKLRNEALGDAARQRAAAAAQRLAAYRTSQLPKGTDADLAGEEPPEPAAPAAPAPAAPVAGPAKDVALQPPAPAAPAPVAGPPKVPSVSKKIQGVGDTTRRVIGGPDINDPEGEAMRSLKANDPNAINGLRGEDGRRLGRSRNKSGSMSNVASNDRSDKITAKVAEEIASANKLVGGYDPNRRKGRMVKNPTEGRRSDWAGHVHWYLFDKYHIELEDCHTGEPIPQGDPFIFVTHEDASKNDSGVNPYGLPEVLVNNGEWFSKMWKGFWKYISGNKRSGAADPSMDRSAAPSVRGGFAEEGMEARRVRDEARKNGDDATVAHMDRKLNYLRKISKFYDLLGMNNNESETRSAYVEGSFTVASLAQKLSQISAHRHAQKVKQAEAAGQQPPPPPLPDDPDGDLRATMAIVQRVKQLETANGGKDAYPFMKVYGPEVTPNTKVTIVPHDVGRLGQEELLGPAAASGHLDPSIDPNDLIASRHQTAADRARAYLQQTEEGPDEEDEELSQYGREPREAHQWSDVFDLMEHWGF